MRRKRRKCFIEYIHAENAWNPINAPGYMYIDCLWECAKHPHIDENGYVLFYTNQCPFNAKYVPVLEETAKKNGITFKAVKLYPEGNPEAGFKISGVKKICFYCNRDGLFSIEVVKGIDDKESGYDDTQEQRELEKAADILFG